MPGSRREFRPWMALAFAALLAGCLAKRPAEPLDSRHGDVAVRTLDTTSSESYPEPDKGESYDPPVAFFENAIPQYPADLLDRNLPMVTVKVRLIVDEGGRVTEVAPLDPPGPADLPFLRSVQAAAGNWKYSPLVRFGKGPGSTTIQFHGVQQTYEGVATALPFHQDYEFTFMQRDGKGFVSASHRD